MNPLSRLLLGSGALPEDLRTALEAEGLEVLAEGRRGSIAFRDFRAPGRRYGWKKVAVAGAVALSRRRIVVVVRGRKQVDVPLDDERLGTALTVSADPPGRLTVAFDAGAFSDRMSGHVEIRLATPEAAAISDRVRRASTARARRR